MTNSPMVTDAQAKVLRFLATNQNATITEIAQGLYVHPGEEVGTNRMHGKRRAAGTILARLEGAGFVEGHRANSDPTIYAITKLGREALA